MKILLVEDDDRIVEPLLEDLRHQLHAVDIAHDGLTAWDMVQAFDYDLIILDVMLPRLDGVSLCQKLRDHGTTAMVLMLTARDTLADKVRGLDAGADDYLLKPFELEELSARIRALSRRASQPCQTELSHGELRLNPRSRTVTYREAGLNLTPKEFMLLECFLRSPNQVMTKERLLERLWEMDSASGAETVKTHITNLRRKLREVGATDDLIQTVYGVGYRLAPLTP